MKNLNQLLFDRAHSAPQSAAYRFFEDASHVPYELSFGALWEQAAAIAARMQAQGLGQEPVLLIAESQRCFVLGFYACLLAGKDCRAQRAAAPRRAARASDAAGGRRRGPLRAGRLRGRAGGRLGRRPRWPPSTWAPGWTRARTTGPRAWPRRSWRRPRPPSCSTPPARPATRKAWSSPTPT
ncbi:hypothetical protein LP420_13595 [Massilia sp. B-10]|nr:hypothetical protein LP420_13595 [Massilia sp. B-10]